MEKKQQYNANLSKANAAEKAVEIIRTLETNGYDASEIFGLGLSILNRRSNKGTSADAYDLVASDD